MEFETETITDFECEVNGNMRYENEFIINGNKFSKKEFAENFYTIVL